MSTYSLKVMFSLWHILWFFFFIGDEMAASSSGKLSQHCSLTLNFLYLENSISFFKPGNFFFTICISYIDISGIHQAANIDLTNTNWLVLLFEVCMPKMKWFFTSTTFCFPHPGSICLQTHVGSDLHRVLSFRDDPDWIDILNDLPVWQLEV